MSKNVNMVTLITRFQKLFAASYKKAEATLGAGLEILSGYETRTSSDRYRWHGLKRNVRSDTPLTVIQCTLDGEGLFVAGRQEYPQRPGCLFAAHVPSDHEYYLPAYSSMWSFVWVILHHPYVVSRLQRLSAPAGPCLRFEPAGELMNTLTELIVAHRQVTDDPFTRENRLFNLLVAFERAWWSQNHPHNKREQLLDRVRSFIYQQENLNTDVGSIADHFNMSRSNFSHYFKSITGFSPGQYVREIRLEKARQLLLSTNKPLKRIAFETGFVDANHLGKAFRVRFGFTPGQFRKQHSGL